jgi:hypothetical protein
MTDERLEELVHSQDPDVLCAAAQNPRLTEDLALALLARRDLPHQALEAMARNSGLKRLRKVTLAIVAHPHTPRHVSLPITRHLYTFELLQLALLPGVPGDLKIAIEETLISRLETISEGERLTLAKRGSTRIAAMLLNDAEPRIIYAALANPALTEAWIVRALMEDGARETLVHAVCNDSKWSLRRDVQTALLRNRHTPLAKAVTFAQALPAPVVREALAHSRLDAPIRTYLLNALASRRAARK